MEISVVQIYLVCHATVGGTLSNSVFNVESRDSRLSTEIVVLKDPVEAIHMRHPFILIEKYLTIFLYI